MKGVLMRNIFKFLFETLTDPLGLPIHPIYEYLILLIIDSIAYKIAYSKVGDMYDIGFINGRTSGSFFHYVIRFFMFCIIWFITYKVIQAYYFVTANWQIILMITGSVAGTAILCILTVAIMRFVKKHRTVDNNA